MNEITKQDDQTLTMREEFGGRTREITVNEIDVQISTAKRYPRSVATAMNDARTIIMSSQKIAESCWYKLPRGGKKIEGPSIRLAEIVAGAWGNIRFGSRVLGSDEKFIYAEGVCHDMEKNTASSNTVSRRITNRDGRRYDDDMVGVTGNAAASIALRNAILRVVPRSVVESLLDEARAFVRGDEKSLPERRAKMIDFFTKGLKIDISRVLAAVEKTKADDIGFDEMDTLRGMANAIKDGLSTAEELFPMPAKPDSGMNLGKKKPGKQAEPEAPPADETEKRREEGAAALARNEAAREATTEPDDLKRQLSDLAFQCYPETAMSVKRSMVIREACGVPIAEAGLAALKYGLRVLTVLAGRFGQQKPAGDDEVRTWIGEIKDRLGE